LVDRTECALCIGIDHKNQSSNPNVVVSPSLLGTLREYSQWKALPRYSPLAKPSIDVNLGIEVARLSALYRNIERHFGFVADVQWALISADAHMSVAAVRNDVSPAGQIGSDRQGLHGIVMAVQLCDLEVEDEGRGAFDIIGQVAAQFVSHCRIPLG
jgi:hypothetical protein